MGRRRTIRYKSPAVICSRWFCHGFSVLGQSAQIGYLCTEEYAAEYDAGILWSDEDIGVKWQIESPRLSRKDQSLPMLKDINPDLLPRMSS